MEKKNVLRILDIILCVLILVFLVFIVSASASTKNTVKARFYVHVVEDIDPSTWGSKPQDSKYYFPKAGNGLLKEIEKPTPSDATDDGYTGKYHWHTWNSEEFVKDYINGGFKLSDFKVPSNVHLTGDAIHWYVIKDQKDGWHVDGYVQGWVEPETTTQAQTETETTKDSAKETSAVGGDPLPTESTTSNATESNAETESVATSSNANSNTYSGGNSSENGNSSNVLKKSASVEETLGIDKNNVPQGNTLTDSENTINENGEGLPKTGEENSRYNFVYIIWISAYLLISSFFSIRLLIKT